MGLSGMGERDSKVRILDGFLVPYDVEELFSEMHGSIDPDTGHIVCHKYTPRVSVIVDDHGEAIPYLTYSGCLGIVLGDRVVGKLLSIIDARHVECLELKQREGLILRDEGGEYNVPVEDLVMAMRNLRILGYKNTKIYLGKINGDPVPVLIGVDREGKREMIALFIDPSCISKSRVEEAKTTTVM